MEKRFVVIMKNGHFLESYKQKDKVHLAFEAEFTPNPHEASTFPYRSFEQQEKEVKTLAEMLGAEVVIMEVEFEFKTLDGEIIEEKEIFYRQLAKAEEQTEGNLRVERIMDAFHDMFGRDLDE